MPSTIFIADDEPSNLVLLETLIKKRTDYDVAFFNHGQELLNAILNENRLPSLIILDIMMPELNGFDVAARLREHPATKGVPIVFVSALTSPATKIRALESGGIDFITKPFNEYELISRLEAHLRMKKFQDDAFLQKEYLETLFSLVSDAVLVVDAKSLHIEDANPAALLLLEGVKEDLRGKPLSLLLSPDLCSALSSKNAPQNLKTSLCTLSQKEWTVFFSYAPLNNQRQETEFFLCLIKRLPSFPLSA